VNSAIVAVVSLFGFRVGVYDVSAIESNDRPVDCGYKKVAEIVALTKGRDDDVVYPAVSQCDQATFAPLPWPINDLTYAPEALLRTGAAGVQLFALEHYRGLFDGIVTPPVAVAGSDPSNPTVTPGRIGANVPGLSLTSPYLPAAGGHDSFDQPRLRTLRNMYKVVGRIDDRDIRPVARHGSIVYYARPPTVGSNQAAPDEYALVASFQYGVTVVKLGDAALGWNNVVDVIWIPAGAV